MNIAIGPRRHRISRSEGGEQPFVSKHESSFPRQMEKSSCEFYLEEHVERARASGWRDSGRNATRYVANAEGMSLGGEYRALKRSTFVHTRRQET